MRGKSRFSRTLTPVEESPPAPRRRGEFAAAPTPPEARRDLVRALLTVLFVAGLIAGSVWILWPFIPALIWATTLVVATWPLMMQVQRRLWNKRWLAVVVMTVALLIVFIAPFWLAIATIIQNFDRITAWGSAIIAFKMPPAPVWLGEIPLFGAQAVALWHRIQTSGIGDVISKAAPYAGSAAGWLVRLLSGFGIAIVQFLLTLVIAAVLYASGEHAEVLAERFGHRLAGARGRAAVRLTGQAIRSVALGVVVTALIQSVVSGLALALAGLPLAPVLTALIFMLCVAQLGPGLVLIPATIWLFWSGEPGWGTFLAICTVIVISLDNVVRPILMRKGVHLPLVLLLAGVIGGLIAFGLVGIFLGPVVLAVAYTLLQAWLGEDPDPDGVG